MVKPSIPTGAEYSDKRKSKSEPLKESKRHLDKQGEFRGRDDRSKYLRIDCEKQSLYTDFSYSVIQSKFVLAICSSIFLE